MAPDTFLGSRVQKAFIFTVVLQGIVVLAMVGVVFGRLDNFDTLRENIKYKTLPCYLALFALAEIFEVLMAFDALRLRNIIQLIGIVAFHLALMVFAAVQIEQTRKALVWFTEDQCAASWSYVNCDGPGSLYSSIKPLLIVVPVIIGASWLAIIFLCKELYVEFGWAIFHVVGANPKMKTMFRFYQIMICLLKFDFFFFTGVTMQLLILVLQRNKSEFGITIAAIPIVCVLLILCGLSVKREMKPIMTFSLVLMLAAQTYFIYKLVRFYEPENKVLYATTRTSLTIFTVLAFILLFATFGVGLRCFSDFDQGLLASKVHSSGKLSRPVPLSKESKDPESGQGVPLSPRLSIE